MAWWKTDNPVLGVKPGYVNARSVDRLYASSYEGESGLVWVVNALVGGTVFQLLGAYANEAEAVEAARLLCQGIDPTTITGGS
ncbi:MAG TPA: hypothetical protein VHK64_00750 [Nocardioidaceae bacterium]|jgi:hypothetical protein|nr:hypothetical protein [Nocardioidaceae bacterium]